MTTLLVLPFSTIALPAVGETIDKALPCDWALLRIVCHAIFV